MEHKKYEYLIKQITRGLMPDDDIQSWLNLNGEKGWELLFIEKGDRYFFKRPVLNKPEQ